MGGAIPILTRRMGEPMYGYYRLVFVGHLRGLFSTSCNKHLGLYSGDSLAVRILVCV